MSPKFVPNIPRRDNVCNTHSMNSALLLTPRKSFEARLRQSMWKCLCVSQANVSRFLLSALAL